MFFGQASHLYGRVDRFTGLQRSQTFWATWTNLSVISKRFPRASPRCSCSCTSSKLPTRMPRMHLLSDASRLGGTWRTPQQIRFCASAPAHLQGPHGMLLIVGEQGSEISHTREQP